MTLWISRGAQKAFVRSRHGAGGVMMAQATRPHARQLRFALGEPLPLLQPCHEPHHPLVTPTANIHVFHIHVIKQSFVLAHTFLERYESTVQM